MKKLPLIKSVMTPFPYSVDIDTLLGDAHAYMLKHDIHHLPVINENRLAGLLNEQDVIDRPDRRPKDIGLREPCVFDLNARLDMVLRQMADKRIDTVLVTRNNKLVGIFTITDACRVFADYLRDEFAPSGGDEAA